LPAKWWYRAGPVTPAAAPMSSIETPWYPRVANSPTAISRISSRRLRRRPRSASTVIRPAYPRVKVGQPAALRRSRCWPAATAHEHLGDQLARVIAVERLTLQVLEHPRV